MTVLTHDDIETGDVVDRYVAGTLDEATSAAFEEHYFACDECFDRLEATDALRRAVRQASRGPAAKPPRAVMPVWLPVAATVALAAGLGWMSFVSVPALKRELAAAQSDRDALKGALATAAVTAAAVPAAEANPAMVTLASERAAAAVTPVALRGGASHVIFVIEGPPSPTGRGRLDIQSDGGADIVSVGGLVRNAQDMWTLSVPSSSLPDGSYRVRLRADGPAGALLGDYRISVSR